MFRTNLPHSYYIYNTRATRPQPKSATWLRCLQTHGGYQDRIPATTRTRKGESKNEKRRETWFVSGHYEPRTEVWRGGTPKVRKLQGISEPNPESWYQQVPLRSASCTEKAFLTNGYYRHMVYLVQLVHVWLSDGNRIFAIGFFA